MLKRVTPVILVDDPEQACRDFVARGFSISATDDPGCFGANLEYSGTGIIVLSRSYASAMMPEQAVACLERGAGLYVWVDNLNEVAQCDGDEILDEVETAYGTRERITLQKGLLTIYAETRI